MGLRSATPALILELATEIGERSYRELAADTAHEIRTMLTPLEGYLVALRRHLDATAKIDDRTKEYFELTHARLQKIRGFTDDLRTYSTPGDAKMSPTPLAMLVADAVATSFEHLGERTNVERAIDVPAHLIVEVVPTRFSRAIANVVTNALQAMKDGGRLQVSARVDGESAVLTIRDTGHGMTPELLEKARERFTTTRRDQGGTGLGLPIAERIVVTDHGGELLVDSTPGAGTVVTIRIPLERAR
jgi:signal transduction histidine kinase